MDEGTLVPILAKTLYRHKILIFQIQILRRSEMKAETYIGSFCIAQF
jgi:hypothetical protein